MSEIVKDPEVLGGLPVFAGTRVSARNLFDALVGGDSVREFRDDFPTVTLEQVRALLEEADCFASPEKLHSPHDRRHFD